MRTIALVLCTLLLSQQAHASHQDEKVSVGTTCTIMCHWGDWSNLEPHFCVYVRDKQGNMAYIVKATKLGIDKDGVYYIIKDAMGIYATKKSARKNSK